MRLTASPDCVEERGEEEERKYHLERRQLELMNAGSLVMIII